MRIVTVQFGAFQCVVIWKVDARLSMAGNAVTQDCTGRATRYRRALGNHPHPQGNQHCREDCSGNVKNGSYDFRNHTQSQSDIRICGHSRPFKDARQLCQSMTHQECIQARIRLPQSRNTAVRSSLVITMNFGLLSRLAYDLFLATNARTRIASILSSTKDRVVLSENHVIGCGCCMTHCAGSSWLSCR